MFVVDLENGRTDEWTDELMVTDRQTQLADSVLGRLGSAVTT
jgi:hypothetical protein